MVSVGWHASAIPQPDRSCYLLPTIRALFPSSPRRKACYEQFLAQTLANLSPRAN